MKKTINTFALAFTLAACSSAPKEESIEIAKVDIFEDSAQNMKTLKDLCSFSYPDLVSEKLGIQSADTLSQISWRPAKDAAGKPSFELVLGPKAAARKREIVAVLTEFIAKKLPEYKKVAPELDEVELAGEHFMRLIEKVDIDSVWLEASPNLSKFASKDDFLLTLEQRKKLFKPYGARSIENRRVASELGNDLKGSFYTIGYVYANQQREEITLEKIDGKVRLLGYHFMLNQ